MINGDENCMLCGDFGVSNGFKGKCCGNFCYLLLYYEMWYRSLQEEWDGGIWNEVGINVWGE